MGFLANYKFIDLFCGVGSFHIAMTKAGAECVFASDIDADARAVYEENHALKPHGDITKIDASDIPEHDILCAGFPCQAFSIGGHRKGFEETRGTLFFDVARIAAHHKPKFLLLENVKGLMSHDGGKTWDIIKTKLKGLGYKVYAKVVDTSMHYAPQKRERIFIVCIRNDIDFVYRFPIKGLFKFTVEDIVENYIDKPMAQIYIPEKEPKGRSNNVQRIGRFKNGTQGYRVYDSNGIGIALCALGGGAGALTGVYMIDGYPRVLTARECARMTGFPDDFKMHKNERKAKRQFGNSIPVTALNAIVKSLHHAFQRAEEAA